MPGFARAAHIWAPSFLVQSARTALRSRPGHVWLVIGDHFEPLWNGADETVGRRRVREWREKWPRIAARHRDSAGASPKYTFFYPEEEYRREYLDALAEMTRDGIADVEIHLHHDGEPADAFTARLARFRDVLHDEHGLLRRRGGLPIFGFIHGNWALDNSRPDGRYCGLNNELTLLGELGCYADFTLPSAPSETQTRSVNRIYWASDDPRAPKSHDTGRPAVPGATGGGDLLMVPGPLAVRFAQDGRLRPRLETGELACQDPPTLGRVRLWIRHAPRIGDHAFIKLFAHGAQERHSAALLDEGHLDALFGLLAQECRRIGSELHYASAWECYSAIARLTAAGEEPARAAS